MVNSNLQMTPQTERIQGEIRHNFRLIAIGFQKLDKIKDPNSQIKQLEELTRKIRECNSLIKEFDCEIKDEEARNPPVVNKQFSVQKQFLIKEFNSYVALRKAFTRSQENKRAEPFNMGTGASESMAEDNVQVASGTTIIYCT